jgi:hypothetical protein
MSARSITVVLAKVVLTMFVASAGLRAQDPNALLGKWKINLAKTKYNAGQPPKNQVITYDMVGDALRLTAEIDNAQGHVTNSYTAKYDGKDYPFTSTARDAVTGQTVRLKRINANTTERTTWFGGKQIGTVTEVVSNGGKALTRTQQGVNAQGQPVDNVQVLDKQ